MLLNFQNVEDVKKVLNNLTPYEKLELAKTVLSKADLLPDTALIERVSAMALLMHDSSKQLPSNFALFNTVLEKSVLTKLANTKLQ